MAKEKKAARSRTRADKTTGRPMRSARASRKQSRPAESELAAKNEDRRMHAPQRGVTVRMYRTGLGDCFLLCFPKAKRRGEKATAHPRPAFVLIDCGVFKGTSGGPDRIKKIAESIFRATNDKADGTGKSRLDLLVATHEHWDHLSGFHESQAQKIFDQFEVSAVWLPWTEDDADPLARELRGLKANAARALKLAYKEMIKQDVDSNGPALRVKSTLNMFGFGDDSGELHAKVADGFDRADGSGEALKWIKDRFKDVVVFREPGPDPKHDGTLPGVPGVRFYVLGPPKDADLIRRLNPHESDDESYSKTKALAAAVESAYFAAFGALPGEPAPDDSNTAVSDRLEEEQRRRSRPFDQALRVEAESAQAKRHTFFEPKYFNPAHAWRRIDGDWLAAAGQFALNVDGLANNSSLVLAIELSPGGRVLLFVGDAQIGNWLSWFGKVAYPGGLQRGKDMVWTLDDGRMVDAKDLLARTVLYKVGHHGSHNATLKHGGLEAMASRWPDEFVAMLPVDENLARNHTTYGEMPLTSIVLELLKRTKGRLLRSDEGKEAETHPKNPKLQPTVAGVGGLKVLEPDKFQNRSDDTGPDGLYFDYTISPKG